MNGRDRLLKTRWHSKLLRISPTALAMGLAACAGAEANCSQQDAAGRWQVTASVTEASSTHVMACEILIDQDGVLADGHCGEPHKRPIPVSSGRIKVEAETCAFDGFFVLGSTLNTLTRATLSNSGTSGEGEGTYDDGSFTFTMTRL